MCVGWVWKQYKLAGFQHLLVLTRAIMGERWLVGTPGWAKLLILLLRMTTGWAWPAKLVCSTS